MRNDIEGPLLKTLSNTSGALEDHQDPSVFELKDLRDCCLNFTREQIEQAVRTFGAEAITGTSAEMVTEAVDHVGMMSQESRVAVDDILPAFGREMPLFKNLGVNEEEL